MQARAGSAAMESRVQGEWTRWADLISADRTRCTRSNSRSSTSGGTATGAGSAVPAAPTANPDHDLLTFCDTHTGSKTPLVGIDGFAMPIRRRVSADALGWAGGPVSRASMSCPCARKATSRCRGRHEFCQQCPLAGLGRRADVLRQLLQQFLQQMLPHDYMK